MCFAGIQMVKPDSSFATATAWKRSHFYLSWRPDFSLIINLLITLNTIARCTLIPLSLVLTYVNLFTIFRVLLLIVDMVPLCLKLLNFTIVLFNLRFGKAVYKLNTKEKSTKGYIFPKK